MNVKDKYSTFEVIRSYVKYVFILVVYISFHEWFESLITENLVNPFFSKFDSAWYTIVFFFVTLAFVLYRFGYLIKYRFKPPTTQLLLLSICCFIYLYYRISTNLWIYESVFWKIKYFDLIPLVTIFEVLLYILASFSRCNSAKDKNPQNGVSSFFLDKEINGSDVDLLGREDLAKKLVSRIENTEALSSFAIGIVGKWGSGKTSFLHLISRNLTADKFIEINFNPWNSSSSQSIVSDFFDVVSSELSKYDGTISKRLNDYSQKLLDVNDSTLMKLFSLITKTVLKDETIEDKKRQINGVIKGIGRKLIVFIDDVDRLDAKEVIEVIRLIRNTANFENTFFVVGYDREYVNNAIKGITDYDSHFFLEKIFQLEVVLPVFEYKILGKVLHNYLKKSIPPEYQKGIETAMFWNGNPKEEPMLGLLDSLRDVTRFSNSFLLSFEALKGEILPYDLFQIECLKIKYPSVYSLLYEKRNFLFDNSAKDIFSNNDCYSLKIEGKINGNDVNKVTVLESVLRESYSKYGITESDCMHVVRFIDNIFSPRFIVEQDSSSSRLSIKSPKGFNKYFANRLFLGQLSENEFNSALLLKQDGFNSKILEWVSNELSDELRQRLELPINSDDRTQFEKIVRGIFYFGNIPSSSRIGDYRGFNESNLFEKLSDFDKRITKKYYDGNVNDYKHFLASILTDISLDQTSEREFASHVIKKYEIDLPLSRQELYEIVLASLKKYLVTKKDFNDFKFEYYYGCQLVELDETKEYKKGIPHTAKFEMMTFIDKCFNSFIVRIIEEAPFDENWFKINQFMFDVYGTYNDFENVLCLKSESEVSYLSEFKLFYFQYKANSYKSLHFEFKTIPVLKRIRN